MNDLEEILKRLRNGEIDIEEAKKTINLFGLEFVGEGAKMDTSRHLRRGIPEIIFVEKKRPKLVVEIVSSIMKSHQVCLLSRVFERHLSLIKKELGSAYELVVSADSEPYTVTVKKKDYTHPIPTQRIGILTAGSSDIPIAEEAEAIARIMGVDVISFHDVGIAGVHRLFTPLRELIKQNVKVIIVIAGMEGALPAIVSGLVTIPVIGVPASTGYGYGGKGVAALMSMLQSCSPGLVVVNIDNGINAGATAALIAKQSK
ncbi:MAG: nickel pincer cofactor biosynthesis protein LarB [Promethearchaeota archaeon]|jgi:NCAIR mutase (PurE)-related protein